MLQLLRNKKAFTLIELIIVIIIVAVLAAVATQTLSNMIMRARLTEVINNIYFFERSMKIAIMLRGAGVYTVIPAWSDFLGAGGDFSLSRLTDPLGFDAPQNTANFTYQITNDTNFGLFTLYVTDEKNDTNVHNVAMVYVRYQFMTIPPYIQSMTITVYDTTHGKVLKAMLDGMRIAYISG